MSKIIILDAGHGGTDPGATNGSLYESNHTLKLSQAVQKLLIAQELTVLMTRTGDTYVSLANRVAAANKAGADLFVSLHRNSHSNAAANGVEIWIYSTAGAIDEAAAGAVLEQLSAVGIQSNRGIKKGNYHVLRESNMTSMLVELGFISNIIDNQLFDKHFDAYAEAIAKGVCSAMGVVYQTDNTATQSDVLYRVQVGAFRIKQNADAFLETVKQMGLDAFLVQVDTAKPE